MEPFHEAPLNYQFLKVIFKEKRFRKIIIISIINYRFWMECKFLDIHNGLLLWDADIFRYNTLVFNK